MVNKMLENSESRGLAISPNSHQNNWVEHAWWFLMRGDNCETSTKCNVEECLKSFMEGSLKCFPSFSLLNYHILEPISSIPQISSRHPTIILPQTYPWLPDNGKLKIYESIGKLVGDTNLFRTLMDENPLWDQDIRRQENSEPEVLFQGIHINRYTSNHKVIVTNWSDSSSQKPDLSDEEFPIRSFLYFVCLDYHKKLIEQFVERSSFDVSSKILGLGETVFYHDSTFVGFRSTIAISIAFAGKQIKSSLWEIELNENPSAKDICAEFKSFRSNLKFPLDDDRVFGFLLGSSQNQSQRKCLLNVTEIISNILFPCIKYINLGSDQNDQRSLVRLHLIRI